MTPLVGLSFALRALVRLAGISNQICDQLNVVSNFPGNQSAGLLVTARDISCQGA